MKIAAVHVSLVSLCLWGAFMLGCENTTNDAYESTDGPSVGSSPTQTLTNFPPNILPVTISPRSLGRLANSVFTNDFTAHGGNGIYEEWEVSNPSLGTITPWTDATARYVSILNATGVNTVTVFDSNRYPGTATITQE